MKVLLVEDHELSRDILGRILTRMVGVPVLAVESAEEGLAAWAADIRLVVTDLVLPGRGGAWLIRALRRSPRGRDVPVIAVSVDGRRECEALDAGAAAFLEKPFPARAFALLVRAHLASGSGGAGAPGLHVVPPEGRKTGTR